MGAQTRFQLRQLDPRLVAIAAFVLAICLYFTVAYAFFTPISGIVWSANWVVLGASPCISDPAICSLNKGKLQPGDQILSLGKHTADMMRVNRRIVPFDGYRQGDSVPITVWRDGEIVKVNWRLPPSVGLKRAEFLFTTLVIFFPFWLVGTAVLLFMKPRDDRWRLMIIFSYLTALWVCVGIISYTKIVFSSLILHALSWLLVPVFIHFHLVVPSRLYKKTAPPLLVIPYFLCAVLAILELFQFLPFSAYYYGLLLAGLSSLFILIYRSFLQHDPADRLASRLMIAGILLALGPGLIFWVVPTLLGGSPNELTTALAMLAIPIMPLFYGYAIYKPQLGKQESRLNRLMATYALFLVYLTILGTASALTFRWTGLTSEFLVFGLLMAMALLLAAIPLRGLAGHVIERLAYGTTYNKVEIIHYYASRIPEVSNRRELLQLLSEELFPTLKVHQSALLRLDSGNPELLYEFGIDLGQVIPNQRKIDQLIATANNYLPPRAGTKKSELSEYNWVRLVVPLKTREILIGLWLFGRRDPDNYYSQEDIELLDTLGRQLAITLENARLFMTIQRELADRRRVEDNLERYAERLSLLHNIDQAILTAESPQEIAQVALSGIRQLIPCVRTSVALFDYEKEEVELLAAHGVGDDVLPAGLRLPIAYFFQILANRPERVWHIDDLDPISEKVASVDIIRAKGVRAIMSAPLIIGEKAIGTLNLAADSPVAFTDEHSQIAQEVASSVAVAINNARLKTTITQHGQDLQQLSARLIRAQEDERKRISYELHDEIGQVLTAISFNLAAVENEISQAPSPIVDAKLADTKSLIEGLMAQVRSLSLDLRPAMLQDLGLVPTLRWYVNVYGDRHHIPVHFETSDIDDRLPEEIETALYRVIQEALTNVSRHADARQVRLCLFRDNGLLKISIEDDGRGFDPEVVLSAGSTMKGVGLVAIRERVAALNGHFSIKSAPGKGTRLALDIPLGERL